MFFLPANETLCVGAGGIHNLFKKANVLKTVYIFISKICKPDLRDTIDEKISENIFT